MAQGSWQVPTGGSESATTFAGQCNTAWLAVASKSSGASSPANGPGAAPVQFQDWMDMTNALLPVWRLYDGTNWDRIGTLDVSNSVWCPQLGGGMSTIASATSTDIGALPGTLVTITGTATITSLGGSAARGEMKRCYAGGAFTLNSSANIICPGGQSILADVGDAFEAIYMSSGAWLVWGYQRAKAAAGISLPTGATFWRYSAGPIAGTVRANGGTIGNTGSGATEFAGPQCFKLYSDIWGNSGSDPEIVISGGRGASALADWNALKTITLTDLKGRVPGGLDNGAGRLTSSTMSPDGNTVGAVGGAQLVTLTSAQIPVHNHTASSTSTVTDLGHVHPYQFFNPAAGSSQWSGPATTNGTNQTVNTSSATTGISVSTSTTTTNTGSGGSHLNVQPTKLGTWYIAL